MSTLASRVSEIEYAIGLTAEDITGAMRPAVDAWLTRVDPLVTSAWALYPVDESGCRLRLLMFGYEQPMRRLYTYNVTVNNTVPVPAEWLRLAPTRHPRHPHRSDADTI